MIRYRKETDINIDEMLALYNDAGWSAYTRDPCRLKMAADHSGLVITARDNGVLAGLIRIVGDGHTIAYIQDILVLKKYKRRGIGRRLMELALDELKEIRQVVLLTDINNETTGFYQQMGFSEAGTLKLRSYVRIGNQAVLMPQAPEGPNKKTWKKNTTIHCR